MPRANGSALRRSKVQSFKGSRRIRDRRAYLHCFLRRRNALVFRCSITRLHPITFTS
jgi:hypothetical protein